MSAVDDFLEELETTLHVRGRSRRRLVDECRDHLEEASAAHGPEEAVRRFGTAAELSRTFEVEVATRRALRATAVSVLGVLGVAASAFAMLNAAEAGVSAPVRWALVFFGAAQASAVSLLLAVLRAAAMRGETGSPADVALLCRRNAMALGFALLTLFALGAAVPGQTTTWSVLSGPVIALVATAGLARVRSLARMLDPHPAGVVRTPLSDVTALAGHAPHAPGPEWHAHPAALLVPTVVIAMAAAFAWDLLDHGTVAASGLAAAIEAAMTLAGFVFLGRALGLRTALGRRRQHETYHAG